MVYENMRFTGFHRRLVPVSSGQTMGRPLWHVLLFLVLLLSSTASTDGAPYHVAVLYPDVPGNFQKVYTAILDGMAHNPLTRVTPLQLSEQTTPEDVDAWLKENQVRAVVSLGLRGYNVTKGLHNNLPVVLGALVVSPNGITGISLAGAPEEFLLQLRELAPQVSRVFVVYSEKDSGWLVRRAEAEAKIHGVQLVTSKVANARDAVQQYGDILSRVRDGHDAIWLPLDSVIPDEAVMPMVLEAAWKHRLVVFSNNPSHAKMGALFSLYPDNEAMGRHLSEMTVERLRPESRPRVEPTRNLKVAVNRRTASHLGLNVTPGQDRRFDLVYPME